MNGPILAKVNILHCHVIHVDQESQKDLSDDVSSIKLDEQALKSVTSMLKSWPLTNGCCYLRQIVRNNFLDDSHRVFGMKLTICTLGF